MDNEPSTMIHDLSSIVIPEVFPTLQVDHPSPSARVRILFPISRLHSASQTDSPTARRDSPVALRAQQWCFPVPVTGQLFFFPLSFPCSLIFVIRYSILENRCSNIEYHSFRLAVWLLSLPSIRLCQSGRRFPLS